MPVKSPYNFVPISENIVPYENHEQISNDIPFSDGLTGFIELKIIMQTPTFVRNSGSAQEQFFQANIGKDNSFMRIIPGTSLKGTIRNVVEIISFGKLNKVSDHRYSIRDLSNPKYSSKMTKKINGVIYYNVKAGWISQTIEKNETIWRLIPCEFARVEIADLENYYRTSYGQGITLNAGVSSVTKYGRWNQSLDIQFDFKEDDYQHKPGKIHYKKVTKLGNGNYSGRIVFTGQPFARNRQKKIGKHMEFIFFNDTAQSIDVTHLKKEFEFIHSDENEEPNEEWKYWSQKLRNGELMPVFYLEDSENNVESFGLAMMYRLPYTNKISDAIRNSNTLHFPKEVENFLPDLSDALFGYTHSQGNKNFSLKGRVQFGHFFETSDSAKKNNDLQSLTKNLGSPKPTFYPYYVLQKIDQNFKVPQKGRKNEYKTYMDHDVKINGWKRYPSEDRQIDMSSVPVSDTTTTFIPINEGSEFVGKIGFFNLRPFELGALLWAISYGNNPACQHKIGMAKPLGFGRVMLLANQINIIYGANGFDQQYFIGAFEKYMSEKIDGWKNSEQIKELLTMADITYSSTYESEYPVLDPQKKINEFVKEIKNKGYALPKYSIASNKNRSVQVISPYEIKKRKEKEAKLEAAISANPNIKNLVEFTNSELKDFIRNDKIALEEKKILLEAFDLLSKSKKQIIVQNLNKGKGAINKVLIALEKNFGKKFPRG